MTHPWRNTVTYARTMVLLVGFVALATARHRIGEKSTLLQSFHSRQVAFCRKRGNLFAWYPPLKKCMPLLEESAACQGTGDVLVLNSTTLEAQCMNLPCDITHVLRPDGLCHTKEDFCSHAADKELVLKESGYGTCDCPDLHVYWTADDRCYPAFTQGPCAEGEYIVFREGAGVFCERSPCPKNQVQWRNKCVPRVGHGCLDSVHGHLVLNPASLQYECTIRCPDGMVELGLDCYYLYSRGPCPEGQYVVQRRRSSQGECQVNPCLEDGLLKWEGKCWQRGQYCSNEKVTGAEQLSTSSDNKQPQKREPAPVILPHDDHFTILGVEDLRVTEPVRRRPSANSAVQALASQPPPRRPPASQAPDYTVSPPVVSSQSRQPVQGAIETSTRPSTFHRGGTQGITQQHTIVALPQFTRPTDIPVHHSVVAAPHHFLPPRRNSATAASPPLERPANIPVHHSVVAAPPHLSRPDYGTSAPSPFVLPSDRPQESQRPWHHIFLPPRPEPGELQGQICGTHVSQVAPPPDFVKETSAEETSSVVESPSDEFGGGLMLSMVPPPPPPGAVSSAQQGSTSELRPELNTYGGQASGLPQDARPDTEYPALDSQFSPPSLQQNPVQPSSYPEFTRPVTAEPTAQPPTEQHSWFPSIPNGYLPPPPSPGRRRRHASYSFNQLQRLLEIDGLQPQGSKVVEKRLLPPPDYVLPQGGFSQPSRQARLLDTSTAARLAELRRDHGFHTIDEEHPFSGGFESTSEVHGLHINVNPLTHEVECSDAIGFYRTISFAHYKCRPGSRRDQLGECHHERPGWTDLHPDRCPFGKRHNILTGKCIRVR